MLWYSSCMMYMDGILLELRFLNVFFFVDGSGAVAVLGRTWMILMTLRRQ